MARARGLGTWIGSRSCIMRYGNWEVIGVDVANRARSICLCKCGNRRSVATKTLRSGASTQCADCARKRHGEYSGTKRSSEYLAFRNAKDRCNNPRHYAYRNYGGRGIEFRFTDFSEFLSE